MLYKGAILIDAVAQFWDRSMQGEDQFIRDANVALEADAYHQVRRNAQGEIEMLQSDGGVLITFTNGIAIDDLVSVSTALSETWLDVHNAAERTALNMMHGEVRKLRKQHRDGLTAAHIEAMFEEILRWYAQCDQEAADEARAMQDV
jgi:hypothetical protein